MKYRVRIGTLVLTLGLAAFLSGCASHPTYAGQRVRSARDFEIVETSTKRILTPQEMAHLKAKVADYLDQEGVTENGDYYVKIYLGEEEGMPEGEWVVVRYTREPAVRFSVLASYPGYYDSYHSTYAYDYYPFPHYGFGRLSFQYYDYPFYGYRHYPGPRRHHPGRGHHGDHGGKPGGRPDRGDDDDHDPSPGTGRPSGALKPSFKPTFVPANVNRNSGGETAPAFDARVAGTVRSNLPDIRQRPRSRQENPGIPAPRPAPRRTPDFATRPTIAPGSTTAENPAALRPGRSRTSGTGSELSVPRQNRANRVSAPSVERPTPTQTRERFRAPVANPTTREARPAPVPRNNPASTFKPSAPRSQPVAAPAPAPARSEPAPSYKEVESRNERESSSSSSRANNYDRGRREPDR